MDDTVASVAADDDGWVKLAVDDTAAVADVLLLLRHADPAPPFTSKHRNDRPALKLEWSVRQRRSGCVPRQQHDEAAKERKKGESSGGARASPTTPLSWSGGTSVSGAGDGGSEESSKPDKPTGAARSKLAVRSGTTISKKRPRKKKTAREFKEEESLLLKERKTLKTELATLRLTVEKQRATNESLKKMKLELQFPQTTMKAIISPVSGKAIWHQQHPQVNTVDHPTTFIAANAHCNDVGTSSQRSCQPKFSCKVQEVSSREAAFSLPDLNIPFENEPSSEVLYGLS